MPPWCLLRGDFRVKQGRRRTRRSSGGHALADSHWRSGILGIDMGKVGTWNGITVLRLRRKVTYANRTTTEQQKS